ncbi:diguanylate cyclase [Azorhizobium oxalatiphilum]|uniref:diguanylate cyclase n=1 Tax=Azorhizobium oxalatiphilum TaxID=980631 RepID=A0A917BYF6_9HYPH|nr:sensor domain-containing diguanylate cyclase [Azorhizobium oxalatiphilum]GGF63296.1 diguanylate cyclase [Azorhizobium oxalatiphilum]
MNAQFGFKDQFLARISQTLSSARTVEEITRPLLELLEFVTGLESTYLTHIDLGAGVQNIVFSRNSKIMQIPEGLSVPWGDTLCKRAMDEKQPFADDVATRWGDSDAAKALGIQTYASTPVYLDGGSLYGTLCAASSEQKPLTPDGKEVLTLFSALIAQQIQREQLVEELQRANAKLEAISFTDALTGLPNRRFVLDELQRLVAMADRTGQRVLVAFIDLDGFKGINDTYGHEAGDVFLVQVGERLSAGLRTGDVLGRLGGDEFVVVGLTSAASEEGLTPAEAAEQRLAPLLKGKFDLGAAIIDYPGASFGVIDADPAEGNAEDMLRKADALMYANKQARRKQLGLKPR